MLQSINTNAVQGAGPASADAVAASTLEMGDTQPGVVFELQPNAHELPAELDLLLGAAEQPIPEAVELMPVDPERWLNSMLQQQSASVEARETQPQAAEDAVLATLAALAGTAEQTRPLAMQQTQNVERAQLQVALAERPLLQAEAAPAAASSRVVTAQVAAPEAITVNLSTPAMGMLPEQAQAERLSTLASTAVEVPQAASLGEASAVRSTPLSQTLKLQAPQAQWGEQMLQSLRDSVEMQINQRVQNATIRLDPPELGSLEIFLSHEGGRITVQLSAANADVARLLQQTSERLRQELVAQNFVQVNVQVSADSQGGRQQGQRAFQAQVADEAVLAAQAPDSATSAPSQDSASDVLVTV